MTISQAPISKVKVIAFRTNVKFIDLRVILFHTSFFYPPGSAFWLIFYPTSDFSSKVKPIVDLCKSMSGIYCFLSPVAKSDSLSIKIVHVVKGCT